MGSSLILVDMTSFLTLRCIFILISSIIKFGIYKVEVSTSYFELTFIYGVRQRCNLIICHADIQFSQNHLFKTLLFPHCILNIFMDDHMSVCSRVYFWSLYPISLVHMSVFLLVQTILSHTYARIIVRAV
jgi:hypothetical protein